MFCNYFRSCNRKVCWFDC